MSNLTLACRTCNWNKGNRPVDAFLARIMAQARAPLRDATAVNATPNGLFASLLATGLPVETAAASTPACAEKTIMR